MGEDDGWNELAEAVGESSDLGWTDVVEQLGWKIEMVKRRIDRHQRRLEDASGDRRTSIETRIERLQEELAQWDRLHERASTRLDERRRPEADRERARE